jgi:hypothetical protein
MSLLHHQLRNKVLQRINNSSNDDHQIINNSNDNNNIKSTPGLGLLPIFIDAHITIPTSCFGLFQDLAILQATGGCILPQGDPFGWPVVMSHHHKPNRVLTRFGPSSVEIETPVESLKHWYTSFLGCEPKQKANVILIRPDRLQRPFGDKKNHHASMTMSLEEESFLIDLACVFEASGFGLLNPCGAFSYPIIEHNYEFENDNVGTTTTITPTPTSNNNTNNNESTRKRLLHNNHNDMFYPSWDDAARAVGASCAEAVKSYYENNNTINNSVILLLVIAWPLGWWKRHLISAMSNCGRILGNNNSNDIQKGIKLIFCPDDLITGFRRRKSRLLAFSQGIWSTLSNGGTSVWLPQQQQPSSSNSTVPVHYHFIAISLSRDGRWISRADIDGNGKHLSSVRIFPILKYGDVFVETAYNNKNGGTITNYEPILRNIVLQDISSQFLNRGFTVVITSESPLISMMIKNMIIMDQKIPSSGGGQFSNGVIVVDIPGNVITTTNNASMDIVGQNDQQGDDFNTSMAAIRRLNELAYHSTILEWPSRGLISTPSMGMFETTCSSNSDFFADNNNNKTSFVWRAPCHIVCVSILSQMLNGLVYVEE